MSLLLVSVEQVKSRMALSEDLSSDPSIESAILAAQSYIASVLDSSFETVTSKADTFFLDTDIYAKRRDEYRLRLRQGFLGSTPSLVYATSYVNLSKDPTAIDPDDFRVDLTKGIVYVTSDLEGYYTRVTYDAGFALESEAPDWLKEVILAYVPSVINVTQVTNRSSEVESVLKGDKAQVAVMLEPYMRGRAFHSYPM